MQSDLKIQMNLSVKNNIARAGKICKCHNFSKGQKAKKKSGGKSQKGFPATFLLSRKMCISKP